MASGGTKKRILAPAGAGRPGRAVAAAVEYGLKAFSRLPLLDRVHPWLRPDKTEARWLPINRDIMLPDSAPLPLELLFKVIDEASHRVIIDYCGCRKAFGCRDYPSGIGCLMMGDSALEITSFPGREVGPGEAREHAVRAVDAGLVPVVGKVRADNFIFKVEDRGRLFTTCFCCECCCVTRYTALAPAGRLDPLMPKLEGLSIEVTDRCKGCGTCVEHCYIGAIEVRDGRAVINEYCRGCGRCAMVCRRDAIEVRIADPDFLDKALESIRSHVDWGQL